MSFWDFLHPGLGDDRDVEVDVDGRPIGHLTPGLGSSGLRFGTDRHQHGLTYLDAGGVFHHQTGLGAEVGRSWFDVGGTVHHADDLGNETGRSWSDAIGEMHHVDALGHEMARTHLDALGHVHLDVAPGVQPLPEVTDPFDALNRLLRGE